TADTELQPEPNGCLPFAPPCGFGLRCSICPCQSSSEFRLSNGHCVGNRESGPASDPLGLCDLSVEQKVITFNLSVVSDLRRILVVPRAVEDIMSYDTHFTRNDAVVEPATSLHDWCVFKNHAQSSLTRRISGA